MKPLICALVATLAFAAASATIADPISDGKALFKAQCSICHDDTPARRTLQAPPLFGVSGRKIGTVPGYAYSDALKTAGASGKTWSAQTLSTFLADPQSAIPGTSMPVSVTKASERGALVAYLQSLNAPPIPAKPAKPQTVRARFESDPPGTRHSVNLAKLPTPFATPSAGNGSGYRPGPLPTVVKGFQVEIFAKGLARPRNIRTAPNGDLYVVEAGANRLSVFRNKDGHLSAQPEVFATGITNGFGIAFYPIHDPKFVYASSATTVFRFPIDGGAPEILIDNLPGGGHWTRGLDFSQDGKTLFVAVGAGGNVGEAMGPMPENWASTHPLGAAWGPETDRATVLAFDPDGKNRRIYATGIRNCGGLGIRPDNGDLYCSTNERDGLGDDLVPDYLTRVKQGAWYGWPWYYLGANEDPRHKDQRPDIKGQASLPDLLFQAHSAPLGFAFYHAPKGAASAFPASYDGDIFVALHGSWNRRIRTGSKLVRIKLKDGKPENTYQDFMTGLILDEKTVSGRPVGVAVGPDGALYVSDDGGGVIWRISPKK
jgi:glucose/arabinose dehydrogenase